MIKTTEMFRSHALELEQRTIDWWWGGVAVLALVTVYGVVGEADARREQALVQQQRLVQVRSAYQQGLDDAAERGCADGSKP